MCVSVCKCGLICVASKYVCMFNAFVSVCALSPISIDEYPTTVSGKCLHNFSSIYSEYLNKIQEA